MNALPRTLAAGAVLLALTFAGAAPLAAQTPAAAPIQTATTGDTPQTPAQALAELKANNARVLEQQAALLKRLEQLKKEADQLRIFTKRG